MLGKDIEIALEALNSVKESAVQCINSLTGSNSYRLEVYSTTHQEVEHPAGNPTSGLQGASKMLSQSGQKINTIKEKMFVDENHLNNGYGSPFKEVAQLEKAIETAVQYSSSNSPLNWVSQKASLLSLLNVVVSLSVDAKWAIIYYHDYVQRGYDTIYNDNIPSVTFKGFEGNESLGNLDQEFNENTNIKKESIDPF